MKPYTNNRMEKETMNIVILNGSATQQSCTRGLSRAFVQELEQKNLNVALVDVGEDMLPIFTGSAEQKALEPVKKWLALAEQADAFVICTPEYHNGMSGALKNALDFASSRHFRNKPVLIGAASGGGKGGINALNNLRLVLRGVYALVLPDQIAVDEGHFNDRQQLIHGDMLCRVQEMATELVNVTSQLLQGRKQWP